MLSRLTIAACCCIAFFWLADVVMACPTCKEGLGEEPSNQIQAYFWSIIFMMSMPFLIFGGLSAYFYILIRRDRAARAKAGQVPQTDLRSSPAVTT